jgi:F-box domain
MAVPNQLANIRDTLRVLSQQVHGADSDDTGFGIEPDLDGRLDSFLRRSTKDIDKQFHVLIKHSLSSFCGKPLSCLAYRRERACTGSNVWPDFRDFDDVPARCIPLAGSIARDFTGISIDLAKAEEPQQSPPPASASKLVWPLEHGKNTLPDELIDMILSYLSRDDLMALRLTCQTLRAQVSDKFFKSIVVPFNAGIFDMLASSHADSGNSEDVEALLLKGKNDPKIYSNSLDVFEAFGHHVKKFGMSFEVDEGL